MLGGQGSPYLQPTEFQFSFGYRWQYSDRHFTGDHEDKNRRHEHSEVINDINLLDFNLSFALTERFSASVNLPVLIAERSQAIRNPAPTPGFLGRNETHAQGIGDFSLLGSFWIFEPAAHPDQNIAFGLGVKFPTGEDDVSDNFRQSDGTIAHRTVDQSIQPGDGGYGAIFDLRAFKLIFERFTLYGQGIYLLNPQNTNNVPTFRSRASEAEMSISDQFLGRAGVNVLVFPEQGWSFSIGGRVEGVPVRDLIGDSDGFRRPGIAVSVEPGINYAVGRNVFSFSVPVAVYRNRWISVSDRRDGRHGDAAFADFLILFGYSVRFDGWSKPAGTEKAPEPQLPVSPPVGTAPSQ
ncbi:MAG: hypothetical protein HY717_17060 [Planctomycetes bacterium]|nr:hypothetical protein [Planctomycetota bacterium]